MEHYLDLFHKQHPFSLLSNDEFNKMINGAEICEFHSNQFLLHEEEEEDSLDIHFLLSGLAKNIMHRSNGKQISVRYYYPGELIGLMILMTSGEMKFSVQVLEDTKTLKLQKTAFVEVLSSNPEFSKVVLDEISHLMTSLYHEIKYKNEEDLDSRLSIYHQRVDRFMESPIFIDPKESMKNAAKKMRNHNITSLIVVDSESHLLGTIDQSAVLDSLLLGDQNTNIEDRKNHKPFYVTTDDFIYDAISYTKKTPTTSIPVLRRDIVVGSLRQSSFFKLQDSIYLELTFQLEKARSFREIRDLSPIYNQLFQKFVKELIERKVWAYEICEIISNYNDRIHKRIIELCEEEMLKDGYGAPPVNYCFIVMGSEGRKEQAFSTDQDNGFILSDYDHLQSTETIHEYFKILGNKINHQLECCGFPLCHGGIMAKEDKWRRSISNWYEAIKIWLEKMDGEEIRDFTIFLDFRPIYGDFTLAYELREFMTKRIKDSLNLQQLLMKDTLRFKVPVHPFGRITTIGKGKSIDLKKSAIMQIVNAVRIYSIKYGIEEVNTIKRLEYLAKTERFHPRDIENMRQAIHRLLTFRLQTNLKQLDQQEELSNQLLVSELTKDEKRSLKEALQVSKRIQQVIELSFNRNRVV